MFGDRKPIRFLQTPFNERAAMFSPNGRWVAYSSDENGPEEVYVKEFEGTGAKYQVSAGGGNSPRWRRDGKEIFYIFGGKLMAVDIKVAESGLVPSNPRLLFEKSGAGGFDVTGDGQRFLVLVPAEQSSPEPITVLLNWAADLKR